MAAPLNDTNSISRTNLISWTAGGIERTCRSYPSPLSAKSLVSKITLGSVCVCVFLMGKSFLMSPIPVCVWGASLVAQTVKNLPTMQETRVWSLGWEDPLEKGMATHSSILTWEIPQTEESMGSQRVKHDWATKHTQLGLKFKFSRSWGLTFVLLSQVHSVLYSLSHRLAETHLITASQLQSQRSVCRPMPSASDLSDDIWPGTQGPRL